MYIIFFKVLTSLICSSVACVRATIFWKSLEFQIRISGLVRWSHRIKNLLTLLKHRSVDSTAINHIENFHIIVKVVWKTCAYKRKDSDLSWWIWVKKCIQIWIISHIKCVKSLPIINCTILNRLIIWVLSTIGLYNFLLMKFNFWSHLFKKTAWIVSWIHDLLRVRNLFIQINIGK